MHLILNQASRKGNWEAQLGDALRFRRRIFETGLRLAGIFNPSHREAMFRALHTSGTCACHPHDEDSDESDYEDCADHR